MDENDNFESLRRLLALKRHEIPPPGYFHHFSGDVIGRLRAGEHKNQSADTAEEFFARAPWLVKFVRLFETKPAFAGLFASALCLLLVFGIVSADRSDVSEPQPLLTQTAENTTPLAAPLASISTVALASPVQPSSLALNSTNPVLSLQPAQQPVESLFASQQPLNPYFQQVNFTPPGN